MTKEAEVVAKIAATLIAGTYEPGRIVKPHERDIRDAVAAGWKIVNEARDQALVHGRD